MAAVQLDGVTKRFGDTVAVDRVDLEIDDGEFMVILGPSGCGKSTALRLIAGLEEPDAGAIVIDGEIVNDIEAKHRDLAMVFQTYALYPHMTVRANIAFPLKPLGVSRAERGERAREAADLLGLGELLDRRPAQLSGGQRQRVALARAIVRQPRAFLMDEPLSNLDAKLRTETRRDLVELHERLGTTFVYVTHDQVEAMTMADRIAIMDGGVLQQVGTPDDVYDDPANLFVARFIGSPPMNIWEGSTGENGAITVGGIDLGPLPVGVSGEAELAVATRPESLRFDSHGIAAVVESVESHGHERLVTCLNDHGRSVVRLGAKAPVPHADERVHLAVDPADVLVFDGRNGERLR